MDSKYDSYPIGELAKVRSGYAFKSSSWRDIGVPVVKIANVKAGRVVLDGCSFVDEWEALVADQFSLVPGDILIAMTGYVGEVARVRDEGRMLLNQRVGRFNLTSPERLHFDYLYYCLLAQPVRQEIEGLGYGSAQPNISPTLIEGVEIPLPPLAEQHAIAEVLGVLDDKIELNRRMNTTLEELARTIFRSWFVDFDPVHAKAEGRALFGMDADTAALFPGSFVSSELGDIPAGWIMSSIGSTYTLVMGQSPPGNTYNELGDGSPFYQGRSDFGFRFPRRRVFCTAPTRLAKEKDTLISVRAPVGTQNMAFEESAIGRGVAAVRSMDQNHSFAYYQMESLAPLFDRFNGEGTVFGSINQKEFRALPVVVPTAKSVERFQTTVGPMDDMIRSNELQSQTLAELRDTLLPKLLSGEITVKAAERELVSAT